jgi:outer membrane protein OmpA-like peptidoglycan-associated protein
MRRHRTIIGFALVSALATAVFPFALHAQDRGKFTDFRGRSDYTSEDLGKALFPEAGPQMRERGVGPQQPPQPSPEKASVALNVLFQTNSDKILQQYYRDLDKLGTVLASPQYADYRIQIEGHTDSVGSDQYNLLLSEKRAESVKQYLVQKFPITRDRLVAKGYGKTKDIATNDTPEGRSKNRRVEVVNLGK